VNVALFPLLLLLQTVADRSGMAFRAPDAYHLVDMIRKINIVLLVFNLLPIYPLDGGQILRSLLWYPFGRIRSLQIASVIGLLGGALLTVYAFTTGSIWLVILTFFLLTQAVTGWQQAKALRLEEETLQPASATPAERPPVL
jgi:Zn-dependent protease